MKHMLIIHISTLALLLVLSIIILLNSVKTKNKLVMYLTIGTIVISLGSLIYFLIHHFNEQHKYENNKKMVEDILNLIVNKGMQVEKVKDLKSCLKNQKTINDLTKILLMMSDDNFNIAKLHSLFKSPSRPMTTEETNMQTKFISSLELTLEKDCNFDLMNILKERNFGQHSPGGSYLITALTKAKLLSIGQVYQLRKVMLEAFKTESNHKFFHFYYSHFQGIADFLESRKQLNEIVPDISEVVELSKRGEFQSAFRRYISTARKACQMCKDSGMDVSETEKEWANLEEFKMNGLPEPNTLFVEEPFRKALRHLGTVC